MAFFNDILTGISNAVTVKDYTDDVSEVKYGDTGPYISSIKELLEKTGIPDIVKNIGNSVKDTFDEITEECIMAFQKSVGLEETGILDDATLNALLGTGNSDTLYSEESEEEIISDVTEESDNPHFDSFFSNNNTKNTRKNNQDIVITLGDNTITKTIHNVYMRSINVEYDTSGNPISETYEFIAQDLTESDETKDENKYTEL